MNCIKVVFGSIFIIAVSVLIISCGNNPVSSEDNPPELPTFQHIQHDISYFEDHTPQKDSSNYAMAWKHLQIFAFISAISNGYKQYLSELNYSDYGYTNYEWKWAFTIPEGEIELKAELVANQTSDSTFWELYLSVADHFENLKVLEGVISLDNHTGRWIFNEQMEGNQETPILASSWQKLSENEIKVRTSFFDSVGVKEFSTKYHRDGKSSSVQFLKEDPEQNVFVYWDEESKLGYYQIDSEKRRCWNNNYQDVNCSEVGY